MSWLLVNVQAWSVIHPSPCYHGDKQHPRGPVISRTLSPPITLCIVQTPVCDRPPIHPHPMGPHPITPVTSVWPPPLSVWSLRHGTVHHGNAWLQTLMVVRAVVRALLFIEVVDNEGCRGGELVYEGWGISHCLVIPCGWRISHCLVIPCCWGISQCLVICVVEGSVIGW